MSFYENADISNIFGNILSYVDVASDFMYYYRDIGTNFYLESLTFDQYFKPFQNVYSQVNVGYLELMYAGVRTEVIWKDSVNPFGVGIDVNRVHKRATRGDFKLKPDIFSSYLATFYYDMPNRWNIKIDAGKYLAGDYGATLSVARDFNNGWEYGAWSRFARPSRCHFAAVLARCPRFRGRSVEARLRRTRGYSSATTRRTRPSTRAAASAAAPSARTPPPPPPATL